MGMCASVVRVHADIGAEIEIGIENDIHIYMRACTQTDIDACKDDAKV